MSERTVKIEPAPGVRVPLPGSKSVLNGPKVVDLNAQQFYWRRRLKAGEVRLVVAAAPEAVFDVDDSEVEIEE